MNPSLVSEYGLTGREDSQQEVQAALEAAHKQSGFVTALHLLSHWSESAGYLHPELSEQDETFPVSISGYPNQFLLQINSSRKRYSAPPSGTPKDQKASDCALCYSNVASEQKPLLRVYEFSLRKRPFFIQLTPFPLHPGHFVLIDRQHYPMKMDESTLLDLDAFLQMAPGFTACSNSDVVWAGASILAHHHYQVFENLTLPVMVAPEDDEYCTTKDGVMLALLRYPATVLRAQGPRPKVYELAGKVLMEWKRSEPGRATANIVMTADDDRATVHVIFRHPAYRTAPEWQNFKQEGIGVLEEAGMIIIPAPDEESDLNAREEILIKAPDIVEGIISSNSPVKKNHWSLFWKTYISSVQ